MTDYRLMIEEIQDAEVITSYTRWVEAVQANFRQRALDVAIAEINGEDGLTNCTRGAGTIKTSAGNDVDFYDKDSSDTER